MNEALELLQDALYILSHGEHYAPGGLQKWKDWMARALEVLAKEAGFGGEDGQ